jgi:threonine aldolase
MSQNDFMQVDLRSDTVTRPTAAMLEAMFKAEVGDDVFGEDPSLNALEAKAASLFGKEAGLFCPSGTMANQIGMKMHTNAPGEVICDQLSHVYLYEVGGIGFHSGLSVSLTECPLGLMNADAVRAKINPWTDLHKAPSQLVVLENTCNKGGGACYDLDAIAEIREVCDQHGMKLHLDGARVFNALVAKGYSAADLGQYFDSISICLSKGLGTPVGSVLLGEKDDIFRARRIRKLMGGGMRQAGYLAAAGIYALDHHIERLAEDHARAKKIGDALVEMAFAQKVYPVETNILIFELTADWTNERFLAKLAEQGIQAVPFGPQLIRFVTHLDFDDAQMEYCLEVLKEL